MNAPDIVVIGLGAHGAALVHELARRGVAVAGIDCNTPPHPFGSTTGRTRITREAYYEHPLYVPLVQRAQEIWAELEELTGTVLFRPTGALMAGPPTGTLVAGALASAAAHGLICEELDSDAVRQRFPALNPAPGVAAVYEPGAGVLLVDACVRTLLSLARGYGAEIRMDTQVTAWEASSAGIVLHTTSGELRAARAIFAPGAWLNPLLAAERSPSPVRLKLEIARQTSHWFEPAPGVTNLRAAVCPVSMIEYPDGRMLYTVPDLGHGVKAGLHHGGRIVDADSVDRNIGVDEENRMRWLLEDWMPGAAYRALDGTVCLYTNTPDRHFVLGRHPEHERVLLVSACSGHGFKFAPALAEIAADMMLEGESVVDVSLFTVARVVA